MHQNDIIFYALQIITLLLVTFGLLLQPTYASSRLIATFTAAGPIQNVVILPDRFILGATNNLYVVDAQNLSRLQHASTGPVVDSPYCNAELTSCVGNGRASLAETDNANKVLHYIPSLVGGDTRNSDTGLLLACGSTRQGVCELRDIENIHRFSRRSTALRLTAVAANTANATTVSLLNPDDYDRLYVAATYTNDSPYRDAFPAIATRLLSANFAPINAGAIDGEAAVVVRAEYRAAYRIRYVDVFADEKYVYFGSVQPRSVQSQIGGSAAASLANPLVSRLVRICRNDDKYTSYSEIELQCRSADGKTKYNVLTAMTLLNDSLFGVFTDSEGRNTSAVCIFQMQKIRLTFFYNIDRCRSGTDSVGLPHIGRDAKCFNRSSLPLAEDTCQLGVGGVIESSQVAAIQLPFLITSIDAAVIEDHALVLAGTFSGEIVQMEMSGEHSKHLQKYAQFAVSPDAIDRVRFLDDGRSFLTVSNKELLLMHISSCGGAVESSVPPSLATCEQCATNNRDPLCGWCLVDGRCARQADCFTPLLKRCPRAVGVSMPHNISATAFGDNRASIFVPFRNLPAPTSEKIAYECHFGMYKSTSRWKPSGLSCQLPRRRSVLQASSADEKEVESFSGETNIDFSVRVNSPARVELFSQQLTIYNCAAYSVCSVCTSSKWACRWCASDTKCQNADEKCDESIGTNKCAKIDSARQTEILIPDSISTSISFSVVDMSEGTDAQQLTCAIQPIVVGTGEQQSRGLHQRARVSATLQSGRVRCADAALSYPDDAPERVYALELYSGRQLVDKTSVTVYKCSAMGDDCSQCLAIDPKWSCVWCDNTCTYYSQCRSANGSITDMAAIGSAMQADQLCVRPVITLFRPESAPLDGGTLVEIIGRDLGTKLSDVQNRVHVAGSLCRVVAYEVSRRITCMLDKGAGSGPIRIIIGRAARRSAESVTPFHFRNPIATSIYPVFGPMSGGTRLTIYGEHLRIGSNISVHLDNLPCHVLNTSESDDEIQCLTSASRQAYTVTAVRVQIDASVRMLHAKFTYRADPEVYVIEPATSFESGGRMLSVTGINLDSVLSARMFLLSSTDTPTEIVSDASACQILNATHMKCASPRLVLSPALRQSAYGRWPVGFEMDGVAATRNLAAHGVFLATVADPQFAAFKGLKIQPFDQPLIIEGDRLAQSATLDDYLVTIGTETCTVYLLDDRQLLCRLPANVEPAATDDAGAPIEGGHPLVVVRVGALRVELGPIEIDNSASGILLAMRRVFYRLGVWRTSALAFFIGAALVAAALALVAWRRRQINEHERAYERIRLQIEHMESSVRHECKQAFAELQTDMLSDLSSTLNDTDIPYRRSAQFVARLLFRDFNDLRSLPNGANCLSLYVANLPFALEQFAALLWQRQFVFPLVEWADRDPTVTVDERATLASLLASVLVRNFTYFTDVVLALLSAHINRTVVNDSAHLLFRQSDSVVEKLFQHWITISMLPYVARNTASAPGRHLYLLYKALKLQTEKGPVDAVTGRARYSLSEQCLLRESVDATVVTLTVIPLEGFDQAPLACRVLDCDTITQVKYKLLDLLYRNRPFSARITHSQFDLEWNSSKYGTIILLDDDAPERKGNKRLNTISYYKLPNNCMLTMQPNTSANHSLTFQSDTATTCSAHSARQLLNASSSSTSPGTACEHVTSSPMTTMTLQLGGTSFLSDLFTDEVRYFHLSPPSPPLPTNGTARRASTRPLSALDFDAHFIKKRKKKKKRDPPSNTCNAKYFNNNQNNNYRAFGNNNNNISPSWSSNNKDDNTLPPQVGGASNIPEVFLTRLLMCKTAVLPYVENFFDAVLFASDVGDMEVPIVVRFVLQFLDEEATRNNVNDTEIIDVWKVNALVLRFWMQLLHNLDFLFDIQRHHAVDASLTVVGQTLVDAFSSGEMPLGKESPSSKLLFTKEIARYRPQARAMFRRLEATTKSQKITLEEFQEFILSMHQPLCDEIDAGSAVGELLAWVKSRGIGLASYLERDAFCVKYGLFQRFRQMIDYGAVANTADSDNFYASIK